MPPLTAKTTFCGEFGLSLESDFTDAGGDVVNGVGGHLRRSDDGKLRAEI